MKTIHTTRTAGVLAAAFAAALLGACGGGHSESTTAQELSAQQVREQAALERARAANSDATGKILNERAGRSTR